MTDRETTLYRFTGPWDGPVVATAIHTAHGLRDDVAAHMVLAEDDRFREEDPFTDELAGRIESLMVPTRSRFEVDLNRGPENAVYATPEQSWGMRVWREDPLDEDIKQASLAEREEFYAALAEKLDAIEGPFLLLDCHSYNHRRTDDHSPEPQEDNPDINVGTGSVNKALWAPLVEEFISVFRAQTAGGEPVDARENVKFKGAEMARWVHERYADRGVCLAIEFKKTFMDEWTGQPDPKRIAELADALGAAASACEALLRDGAVPVEAK